MSETTKYISVRFADHSEVLVPALCVAEGRAKYYAEVDAAYGDGEYNEVYKEELVFTLDDEFELLDWFHGNTNYEDFTGQFIEISHPHAGSFSNRSDEWTNADCEVVDLTPERLNELVVKQT
jgi:hypothetical protein